MYNSTTNTFTLIVTLNAGSILQPTEPNSIYTFILPRFKEDIEWMNTNLSAIMLVFMMAYVSGHTQFYSDYLTKVRSIYGIQITLRHIGIGNLPFVFELRFDPDRTYILKGDSRIDTLTLYKYQVWATELSFGCVKSQSIS